MKESMNQDCKFSRIAFLVITSVFMVSYKYWGDYGYIIILSLWIPSLIMFFLEDYLKNKEMQKERAKIK